MKTLQSLTAALLIILSFSASAGTKKSPLSKTKIPVPAFVWGSPQDLDLTSVEALKIQGVMAPVFAWGSPEDLQEDLEYLKVRTDVEVAAPSFYWGTPGDLNTEEVEKLKGAKLSISLPAIVIGNPAEIEATNLK